MHEHAWMPIAGACGRYRCACGGTGYRDLVDGTITAHKTPRPERVQETRRPATAGGGHVGRKPTLDDYDRGLG